MAEWTHTFNISVHAYVSKPIANVQSFRNCFAHQDNWINTISSSLNIIISCFAFHVETFWTSFQILSVASEIVPLSLQQAILVGWHAPERLFPKNQEIQIMQLFVFYYTNLKAPCFLGNVPAGVFLSLQLWREAWHWWAFTYTALQAFLKRWVK